MRDCESADRRHLRTGAQLMILNLATDAGDDLIDQGPSVFFGDWK
jgi:hypothetical protein